MLRVIAVFVTLVLVLAVQQPSAPANQTALGVVSSAHPLATEAGAAILNSGGNAFDAAVAIAATLSVVEPMMSGMGGYGTILIYDADKQQVRFLDSSGKIPLDMNSDMMRPPAPGWKENRIGAKSVSTPGNVNAWDAMSRLYGSLDWQALFESAIRYAEQGFIISERTAQFIRYAWNDMPAHARTFYGQNGKPLSSGQRLTQKDLAASLRLVAEQGRSVFYEGALANKIVETMQAEGSFLALHDLQQDQAEWWDPISIPYRDHEVYTASPPANAFPALIRLGVMEQLNSGLAHNSEAYLHLFAEVTKHAFWCRLRYAGDPEINPPPLDKLLSTGYLTGVSAGLNKSKASEFNPPGHTPEGRNTTHFVVADRRGNIVSATQTLGNLFGSKIMPEGTGIWFNNSLAYCTYEPKGNPMDAIPGQRKLSGDCPVIVFRDGRPAIALGTPGGHTIPQTVPQMLMNMIDYGMAIDEAIAAPRISFVEPDRIVMEKGIHKSVFEGMRARGHKAELARGNLGNAHGLSISYDANGRIKGFTSAADPRGEGTHRIVYQD